MQKKKLSATERQKLLECEFSLFHTQNPHIYEKALELALFLKRHSKRKRGIPAVFYRLRWLSVMETIGDNYYHPHRYQVFYARMLAHEPELIGAFRTRRYFGRQRSAKPLEVRE
jgi:hypothetical protein